MTSHTGINAQQSSPMNQNPPKPILGPLNSSRVPKLPQVSPAEKTNGHVKKKSHLFKMENKKEEEKKT